ncbi:MAG: transcription elongation factor GreA [Candidatus Nanopelagicales bacterium]|nr:transcription elongation factor GreA [Candidatus Nanopelagicales bacterium]
MADVKWLTQEAYDALCAEVAQREGPLRQEIVRRIAAAREEGDLKENSGYHAAKDEQGHNEARVRQLRSILESAQVGQPHADGDQVAHGRVVTIRIPDLDHEETFLLASREEAAHAEIEVYSPTSPLGSAVDGRRVGETVTYELPNGKVIEAQILAVAES